MLTPFSLKHLDKMTSIKGQCVIRTFHDQNHGWSGAGGKRGTDPRLNAASSTALTETIEFFKRTVRARLGRWSGHGILRRKAALYGGFVWARGARNSQKRRFSAREAGGAAEDAAAHLQPLPLLRQGHAGLRLGRRRVRAEGLSLRRGRAVIHHSHLFPL
jgi:hypothetical protein